VKENWFKSKRYCQSQHNFSGGDDLCKLGKKNLNYTVSHKMIKVLKNGPVLAHPVDTCPTFSLFAGSSTCVWHDSVKSVTVGVKNPVLTVATRVPVPHPQKNAVLKTFIGVFRIPVQFFVCFRSFTVTKLFQSSLLCCSINTLFLIAVVQYYTTCHGIKEVK